MITTGKYAGLQGTVEANVHQKTVDYPGEWANGYHVMLDTEELATIRSDQVKSLQSRIGNGSQNKSGNS